MELLDRDSEEESTDDEEDWESSSNMDKRRGGSPFLPGCRFVIWVIFFPFFLCLVLSTPEHKAEGSRDLHPTGASRETEARRPACEVGSAARHGGGGDWRRPDASPRLLGKDQSAA